MKTLLTHSKTFHADDVFAVATFLLAHKDEKWQVIRSREEGDILEADAVLDVGGIYDPLKLRFDHHQKGGAGARSNGIPYATFGLVWKEFGLTVCGGDYFIRDQIDTLLVSPIDANDNGIAIYERKFEVSPYELSQYVKMFNITWKEEAELYDMADKKRLEVFLSLVDWASNIILREIKRNQDKNEAYKIVEDIYNKSQDKRIIILDKFYPWEDVLVAYPDPLYVLYPDGYDDNGRWVVKCVPKEKGSFETRVPLPLEWAGKRDQELKDTSGIPEARFCHNGRFLAVADSRDGALALAYKALS